MSSNEQGTCGQLKEVAKVTFELDSSEWHAQRAELMWARFLSRDEYRLLNVPFYVGGVSYGDVVVAKPKDGALVFQGVSHRGGHSTYRIFLSEDAKDLKDPKSADLWRRLETAGCTYERADSRLIAVDVSPAADIYAVYGILTEGEEAGVWDFEEGYRGHHLKNGG